MRRIETDKTILAHLKISTEERAGNLIEARVARGTAQLRTHVDIDLENCLATLDGVQAARERKRRYPRYLVALRLSQPPRAARDHRLEGRFPPR